MGRVHDRLQQSQIMAEDNQFTSASFQFKNCLETHIVFYAQLLSFSSLSNELHAQGPESYDLLQCSAPYNYHRGCDKSLMCKGAQDGTFSHVKRQSGLRTLLCFILGSVDGGRTSKKHSKTSPASRSVTTWLLLSKSHTGFWKLPSC